MDYSQIKDQALTLTGSGSLEIVAASGDTTIDLSKLNNKVVSGDATALTALKLTNVGSGASSGVTVTLNKDDAIKEAITLDATALDANKATVVGIASGDSVAVNGVNFANYAALTNTSVSANDIKSLSVTTADKFADYNTVLALIKSTMNASNNNIASGAYIIATDGSDNVGAALWKVTTQVDGNTAGATTGDIKLVATFNDANFANLSLNSGALVF